MKRILTLITVIINISAFSQPTILSTEMTHPGSFASEIQYDNPITSNLILKVLNKNAADISFDLVNSLGAILNSAVLVKNSFQKLDVNMEKYISGIYYLSLNDENNPDRRRSLKMIKE